MKIRRRRNAFVLLNTETTIFRQEDDVSCSFTLSLLLLHFSVRMRTAVKRPWNQILLGDREWLVLSRHPYHYPLVPPRRKGFTNSILQSSSVKLEFEDHFPFPPRIIRKEYQSPHTYY
jgi:hypothetical protein